MSCRLLFRSFGILALSSAPVAVFAADPDADREIVVTATRLETAENRTPVATTVLSGEQLESSGILLPTSLDTVTLNVTVEPANDYRITIRGVASQDGSPTGDPSAAFMLDNVYIARPAGADPIFFDIDRVEILKGPQGVLYGRNTPAGIVNIISRRPEPGKAEVAGFARLGNYDAQIFQAFGNVPLGEQAAFRISGSVDRRDSSVSPRVGDPLPLDPSRKNVSLRAQLKSNLGTNATVLLRGLYNRTTGSRESSVRVNNFFDLASTDERGNPRYIGNTRKASELLSLTYLQAPEPDGREGGVYSRSSPTSVSHAYQIDGEVNWDLGPAQLSYLGSYISSAGARNFNLGVGALAAVPATFDISDKQTSHEIRLTTPRSSRLKLQTGVYLFHERGRGMTNIYGLPLVPGFLLVSTRFDRTRVSAFAAYGQATLAVSDRFRLTAGGRMSHDTKFRLGHTRIQRTLAFNPATDFLLLNGARTSETHVDWRAGAEFDPGNGGLLYADVATAFKDGGFNNGCEAGTLTAGEPCISPIPVGLLYYKPEKLTAFEVGYKARLLDGRLSFDASLFRYDYRNLQLSQFTILNGRPQTFTVNAGKVGVTGAEANGAWSPERHTKLSLGLSWLDGHYRHYCPRGEQASGACLTGTPDYRGRPLDRSPRLSLIASLERHFVVGSDRIDAQVRTRWSDDYVVTDFSTPRQYRMPAYSKTDVSLTYRLVKQRCYVELLARNLENAITISSIDGFGNVFPGEPRTYAMTAGFSF